MKVHRGLQGIPNFERSVITFGSFDGIHSGHRVILEKVVTVAKKKNRSSLVISFDPHPREVIYPKDKSLKLISTIDEKIEILENIGIEHFVIIPFKIEFSQISPEEYIENVILKKFDPSYVIIGYDHRFGLNRAGNYELLKQYGKKNDFEVEVIPEQKVNDINISSTKIRNALNTGNIPFANRLLGYPFQLRGRVIKGEQIGRKMGYPTANILPDHPKKLIPHSGIYAVKASIGSDILEGMLYIGDRSTVSDKNKQSVEVHLFDFSDDIYGKQVTIHFYKRVRGDEKFKNITELREAIGLDSNAVKSFFRSISEKEESNLATVAILNFNGAEMLESFLPMVLYSSMLPLDIAVIDNDSDDESIEYLEQWHPEIKVIRLPKNYGFAEGYNKGIDQINTKYTVLLNSDVLVKEKWLDTILELMESDDTIAACQPKIKSLEEKEMFEYAGAAGGMMDKVGYPFCRGRIFDTVEQDEGQYDDLREVFWTSGAAMVVRTDIYKKFNGLDGRFFAHQEEIDFCWRLKNAGYRLMYVPDSEVFHLGGGTLQYDSPRKTYLNYRNNLATIVKNESSGSLFFVLIQRAIMDLGSSFLFLIQGKLKLFSAIWKAYFSFIFLIPSLVSRRRTVQKLVQRFQIDRANKVGRYNVLLPAAYFLKGKKIFSEICE